MEKKIIKDLGCGGSMYIILIYDILTDEDGPKIWRNVFQICKRYLVNIQKSVFEGNISKSKLMALEKELAKYIRKDKDSVIIFKMKSNKWVEKKHLGKEDNLDSNIL